MKNYLDEFTQDNINELTDYILKDKELRILAMREDWLSLFEKVYNPLLGKPLGELVQLPTYDENTNIVGGLRKDFYFLYRYFLDIDNFNILKHVKGIPEEAFMGADFPNKTIEIPNNIEIIYRNAFNHSNITSIIIPDSVDYIGSRCFKDCNNLEKVVLGKAITAIEPETFSNCSKLEEIVIPEGNDLRRIEEYAFELTSDLNIIYGGTEQEWRHNVKKSVDWSYATSGLVVHCKDGDFKC